MLLKVGFELCEELILGSSLDMEGEWQSVEDIFIFAAVSVVVSHINEQSLLVVQVLVKLEVVVDHLHLPLHLVDLDLELFAGVDQIPHCRGCWLLNFLHFFIRRQFFICLWLLLCFRLLLFLSLSFVGILCLLLFLH